MSNPQVPTKSSASLRGGEITRAAHHVTDKEFAEWVKEIEKDTSKQKQRSADSANNEQKEEGKA